MTRWMIYIGIPTYIKVWNWKSYDAAQELRNGDLTRQESIALISKYDGEHPKRWANEIFEYFEHHKR